MNETLHYLLENIVEAEESKLVRSAKAGDEAAIEELDRRYRPMLVRYAGRRVANAADAEDVTQMALAKALTRLHLFCHASQPTGSFRGWLFTITRNTIADWSRKQQRKPDLAQDDNALAQHPQPGRTTIESTASCDLFSYARRRLSAVEYQVLWMKYVDQISDPEIARAIGRRDGTVRVMLTRIRKKLADYEGSPHA